MIGLDDALTAFEAAAFIGRNWARSEAPPAMLNRHRQGRHRHGSSASLRPKPCSKTYGLRVPEGIVCKASEAVQRRRETRLSRHPQGVIRCHRPQDRSRRRGAQSQDRREVEAAAAKRMAKLAPDVLVERMVTGAVAELIIGLKRDPQFGLALVIGAGGILTELLQGRGHPAAADLARRDRTGAAIPQGLETGRRLPRQVRRSAGRHRGHRGGRRFRRSQSRTTSRNSTSTPCSCCPDGAVAVDALIRMRKE